MDSEDYQNLLKKKNMMQEINKISKRTKEFNRQIQRIEKYKNIFLKIHHFRKDLQLKVKYEKKFKIYCNNGRGNFQDKKKHRIVISVIQNNKQKPKTSISLNEKAEKRNIKSQQFHRSSQITNQQNKHNRAKSTINLKLLNIKKQKQKEQHFSHRKFQRNREDCPQLTRFHDMEKLSIKFFYKFRGGSCQIYLKDKKFQKNSYRNSQINPTVTVNLQKILNSIY